MQTSLGTAQVTEAPDKQHSDVSVANACELCDKNSFQCIPELQHLASSWTRGNGEGCSTVATYLKRDCLYFPVYLDGAYHLRFTCTPYGE